MARPQRRPPVAASCSSLLLLITILVVSATAAPWHHHHHHHQGGPSPAPAGPDDDGGQLIVGVDGTQFVVGGGKRETIYFSGFNAYWLMLMASDPARRDKVVAAFRQAAAHGLNLARTWAFSDGGDAPLQVSPGVYDEAMFQGLDFVIAEARRHGIYLLLCLTNNFPDFGGKRQYVRWARDAAGHHGDLATDDAFFTNPVVKRYYKRHAKTVLTRVNTLTGVAYKDDPTILGWELMNEPRCDADPTGATVQSWVEEMAPFLKRVDARHLLTPGLEGFYGAATGDHESPDLNPWGICYCTNYVATHAARGVDFATIHLYPDLWLWGAGAAAQLDFVRNWTHSHERLTEQYIGKPLLVTEYGKFTWDADRTQRDAFLDIVLESIYASAARGGPLVGGAFWQLLLEDGMDTLRDGYEIILPEDPRAAGIIGNHSRQLAQLNGRDAEALRRWRRAARSRRRHDHSEEETRNTGAASIIQLTDRRSNSSSDDTDDTPPRLHELLVLRLLSLFRPIDQFVRSFFGSLL